MSQRPPQHHARAGGGAYSNNNAPAPGSAAAVSAAAATASAAALKSTSDGAPREATMEEILVGTHQVSTKTPEQRAAKYDRMLRDSFGAFENPRGSGGCDVRDVGTLVRSVNLVPSEAVVMKIIEAAEEEQSTGSIRYERLHPILMQCLLDREYAGETLERHGEGELRRALAAMDPHRTGHVMCDVFLDFLRAGREPLSQQEQEILLEQVVDTTTGQVVIDDYISLLLDQ